MKAFVLAAALLGMLRPVHSFSAGTVEDTVVLTLNSTRHCVGDTWDLKVSDATPNAPIRLMGVSNNTPWEIPQWATTDAAGSFRTNGTFAPDAAGRHTLQVEITAHTSNIVSFEVVNCGWRKTGFMNTSRAWQTATLLSNGNVLVIGNWSYTAGGSDSAELYDPATETWAVTGRLTAARVGYTATLLANGKVLVAGGYVGTPIKWSPLTSAEIYDPETGAWSLTGNLHSFRTGHTATRLQNGKVLVTAGDSDGNFGGLPSSELYDPETGTWSITGSLPYPGHLSQVATLLANGKVLLVGGIDNRESYPTLGGAALYDPATGTWTTTRSPITPRADHTATLLPNGKVLVDGGFTELGRETPAELYDPETETWTTALRLNTQRVAHTATLLPNGKILFVGNIFGSSGIRTNGAWTYAPDTGTWSDFVPHDADYHTATMLPAGNILLTGGWRSGAVSSAELYDGGFAAPLLTLNAATYCVGAPWRLSLTGAPLSASVRLIGVSRGASWEIPRWGGTDADGKFIASGSMDRGTEGAHSLRVEINGIWSNAAAFVVTNCGTLLGPIDAVGGIDCFGGIFDSGVPAEFGTVQAIRISDAELVVTATLKGGDRNQRFSMEIFEAGSCSASDNAADTGGRLNSDNDGNGQATVSLRLPYSVAGFETLGDGRGSEVVVVVLDVNGHGDRYVATLPLPPVDPKR